MSFSPYLVLLPPLPCLFWVVWLLYVNVCVSVWGSRPLYENPAMFLPFLLISSHLSLVPCLYPPPCWERSSVSSTTKRARWWAWSLLLVVLKGTSSPSSADGADSFIPPEQQVGQSTEGKKYRQSKSMHARWEKENDTCMHLIHLLKFQVILFLRQKPVECYIGVNWVDFNALGHLDKGRQGRNWGRHTQSAAKRPACSCCLHRLIKTRGTFTLPSSAAVWAWKLFSSSSFSASVLETAASGAGAGHFLLTLFGPNRHVHVCAHRHASVFTCCLLTWLFLHAELSPLLALLTSLPLITTDNNRSNNQFLYSS